MAEASGRVVIAFMIGAAERGVGVGGALERAGLPTPLPDDRVPCEKVFALAADLAARDSDPLFGLRQAESFRPHHLGVPGALLTVAPTLGEALDAMSATHRLYGDGLTAATLVRDGLAMVSLALHPSLAERPPRTVVESYLARLAVAVREATSGLVPLHVRFRHGPPAGVTGADYEAVLRCPVRFWSREDALVYPAASLATALPGRDVDAFRVLRDHGSRRLDRLAGSATFTDAVRSAIASMFDGTPVTAARTARALDVSVRTLQRRLAAEGAAFGRVKDDVVTEFVLRQLDSGRGSLDELSVLVGYRDSTGLRRAVRRAIGRSALPLSDADA